ncbi:MAG: CBS domain-containing protein [Candidatus Tectomicrobia bacterium]|uniref:CBS domain-containing protein n=1 Tax=Tectimicrobiota bacterium TaxID=2528274 RepID=A0A932I0Z6_UNCTE|nr:CBS domain-containing protein [Candidatus Tectomicrobia bacterium]
MLVGDACKTFTPQTETASADSSIEDLIRAVARDRGTRYLHIVDGEGKLLGIVGVRELMRVVGSQHINRDIRVALAFARAQTARDIMREAISVRTDDTVEKALEVAVKNWLDDLPVTDEAGRVVGYLDCFEILTNLEK